MTFTSPRPLPTAFNRLHGVRIAHPRLACPDRPNASSYNGAMTTQELTCPECGSIYNYELGGFTVCSECGHEWVPQTPGDDDTESAPVIRDAVGNVLTDGDTVSVTQSLKVKGSPHPIKPGTKVKNIRLLPDATDGHDIDCKVDGFGAMKLKSSVVKKV